MAYGLRVSRGDYPMTFAMNVLLMSGCLAALGAALVRAHGAASAQTAALVFVYAVLAAVAGLSACAFSRPRARALQTLMLIANCAVVVCTVCAVSAGALMLPFRAFASAAGVWPASPAGLFNAFMLCSVLRADARLALS